MFYYADETKPPLHVLLDTFAYYASVDNLFFLCNYDGIFLPLSFLSLPFSLLICKAMREIAILLAPLDLALRDLYVIEGSKIEKYNNIFVGIHFVLCLLILASNL